MKEVVIICIGYYSAVSCGGLGKLAVLSYSETPYCQRMGMSALMCCGIKVILKCMGQFILLDLLLLWSSFKMCTCGPSEEERD